MKTRFFFACLICISLNAATLASAERAVVSIDEIVNQALDASPIVKEIEASRAARSADAFESKTLSNPTLDVDFGMPSAWKEQRGDNEFSVSLGQPFRMSHGTLRNRVASLFERVANVEREQALLQLIARSRVAFARLWLLSEQERVLKEIQPKAKSFEAFVLGGVKQGTYGAADSAVFRTEIARNEAKVLAIAAEKLAAEAELANLTGLEVGDRQLIAPGRPKIIPEAFVKEQLANNELRIQARAKALDDLVKAELAVANRDAFPELRPKLFYSRTNEGADLVGLALSVDLPFFSRNSAERLRKSSEALSTAASLNFVQSDVFKKAILKSVVRYELTRQQLTLYETKVVPSIKEALSSFESQVRHGQGSVFQLWQTLREYIEAQETFLELWAKAFSEHEELSILLGQEV